MKLSAIVLTKNEEKNIEDCLKSLAFCDEVIVIDSNSSDNTRTIAQKLGAKVFIHPLNNDFAGLRNFGLGKARNNWVCFVDADERVPDALASEISSVVTDQISNYDGFYLKRSDIMWGKELHYGETRNLKLLRLAKKDRGIWEGRVHEVWKVKGRIGEIEHRLLHYPHPTVAEFLLEINQYSDIRSKELYEKGIRAYWWSIILYPKMKFLVNYFLKRGFLDGIHGFVFAIIMSFHSFLVRGKLWLTQKKSL